MAAKNPGIAHLEVDGVAVDVDRSVLEDFDALEYLADLEDGNPLAAPRLMRLIFGDDYKRVKAELNAANGGRATSEAVVTWFGKLLTEVSAKN